MLKRSRVQFLSEGGWITVGFAFYRGVARIAKLRSCYFF